MTPPITRPGYFSQIGQIKIDKKKNQPKIWLYRDKTTGQLKGDGTVTFEDPFSAASAVSWFDKKEWNGAQEARGCLVLGLVLVLRAIQLPASYLE